MARKSNEKPNYYEMDADEFAKNALEKLGIEDVEEWGYLKVVDMLEAHDSGEVLPADELFGANLEALQELFNEYEFDTKEEVAGDTHVQKMKLWGVASAQLNALYDLIEFIIKK
jgi:hypothetical protein